MNGGDRGRKGTSGFTLIELVVVVVIVTAMMGLAVSRIDFLVPKYRLRAATRQTAAALQQARSTAAATGRDVFVRIHLSEGKYELLVPMLKQASGGEFPGLPPELQSPPEYEFQSAFARSLPEGPEFVNVILGTDADQTVTSGRAQVRISPFGASDHVIVNFRYEDKRAALRLNGLTGGLEFFESEKQAGDLLEDHD